MPVMMYFSCPMPTVVSVVVSSKERSTSSSYMEMMPYTTVRATMAMTATMATPMSPSKLPFLSDIDFICLHPRRTTGPITLHNICAGMVKHVAAEIGQYITHI